jgi:chromosome segregation ATPase
MGRGLGSLVSSLLFSYAEDMDDAPRDSSDLEKRLEEAIARQQAQLDAFIEETENELAELKSELTSSFEELKELAEKQAEIPDSFEERLSDLEKTKMNAPTERELRRQEEDAEISRIIKIEEENNAERRLVEIEERLERIKDGDDESLKEMDVKLAELEGKLKLLQEYVRSRLK